MCVTIDLSGEYEVVLRDATRHVALFPASLDENRIGYPDKAGNQWHPADGLGESDERNSALLSGDIIKTRLTRKYTYSGAAVFIKSFKYEAKEGERVFLDIERARKITSCKINGNEAKIKLCGTLSTPYSYEITDYIKADNVIEITSDNTYPGWPAKAILYSSAATDETQTNWNGLLGIIRLRKEQLNYVSWVRVYPYANDNELSSSLKVIVDVDVASEIFEGDIYIESEIISNSAENAAVRHVRLDKGHHEIVFDDVKIKENLNYWDEYEGNLHELTAGIGGEGINSSQKTVSFGLRRFSGKGGHLCNNGHRIFLRSESNCAVFPETGHMPLTIDEWLSIMETYKSYGVNCVRFHSHCPPEAAFVAADRLGMFVQPELSHWDPDKAFESEESRSYYELELKQILYCYANHPSFVMLTLGNELCLKEKRDEFAGYASRLIDMAKSLDLTRLYAEGSNAYYGEHGALNDSDFYTSFGYRGKDLRGTNCNMEGYINNKYPDTRTNYDEAVREIRKVYDKPVFSFEVGQFEVLPDFEELKCYNGVTKPDNIQNIYDEISAAGFLKDWKKRVEVTGEMAFLSYREEIEAAMRTRDMSGISLLGLQDFTGQGTALVGMLNPHLSPKPYDFAQPERFRKIFTNILPLAFFDRYTYFEDESFKAEVWLANYGKSDVCINVSEDAGYELWDGDRLYASGVFSDNTKFECGGLKKGGIIEVPFKNTGDAKRLDLKIFVGEYTNEYSIFVYSRKEALPGDATAFVAGDIAEVKALLEKGMNVYFEPDFETYKDGRLGELFSEGREISTIKTCFTTDFWSVGTFAAQEGYMGCMIDTTHPVFKKFPTKFFPEWQWWIITKARAMVIPDEIEPLLEVLDCYARLRKMAFMFERKVGSGKLLVSSLGLLKKQEYPEARALLRSICEYMSLS